TGAPSTWSVQAPHRAMPQPNFVPVNPSCSRTTQRSGVSGSASTRRSFPLTLSSNIALPFRRTDEAQAQALSRKRHRAQAASARGKDRVGEGRADEYRPRLADAAQLFAARNEFRQHLRRFGEIRKLVAVEVALNHGSLAEGDLGLAVGKPIDHATLDVRF